MKLIFDTETTGLPPYAIGRKGYIPPIRFLEWNNCRVVQLAWMMVDDTHNVVKRRDHIIKPKFYEIPEESTKIHGISQAMAKKTGIKIENALEEFLQDVRDASLLISHNVEFDYHVVLAEVYRALYDPYSLQCIPKHCTMKHGCLPNEKWPKLEELYEKYFQHKPELVQHRALNDVELCYKIYLHQTKSSI